MHIHFKQIDKEIPELLLNIYDSIHSFSHG